MFLAISPKFSAVHPLKSEPPWQKTIYLESLLEGLSTLSIFYSYEVFEFSTIFDPLFLIRHIIKQQLHTIEKWKLKKSDCWILDYMQCTI